MPRRPNLVFTARNPYLSDILALRDTNRRNRILVAIKGLLKMAPVSFSELGALIRRERERKGLSIRALGKATHIDAPSIMRIERGERATSAERLARIADVLEIDEQDLFALAGIRVARGLPELSPYLRTKYDMSVEAVHEMEAYFKAVEKKYGDVSSPYDLGENEETAS